MPSRMICCQFSGRFQSSFCLFELFLPVLELVDLDRLRGRVHVTHRAVVVREVPGRAHEHPAQVHQLARGEVGDQGRDQEQVGIEQPGQVEITKARGTEGEQPHSEVLHPHHVGLVDVAQQQAGHGDARDQEEREVVRGLGDVAYLRVQEAATDEEAKRYQQQRAGHVNGRETDVEETVDGLHLGDQPR